VVDLLERVKMKRGEEAVETEDIIGNQLGYIL
jgi:hypothetical protein